MGDSRIALFYFITSIMKMKIFQVDAFTSQLFRGNPAAVCPLDHWLDDEVLQSIAAENNLSETAFYVADNQEWHIRWFTPVCEVELCGHATLATAHVLSKHLGVVNRHLRFNSLSGPLSVEIAGDEYQLDFPADEIKRLSDDHEVTGFFSTEPLEVWKGKTDYLLRYREQDEVNHIEVNFRDLAHYDGRGVIITSLSNEYDFISRCFYPQAGINEDPATGSAHTTLGVYWNQNNGRKAFTAFQASRRGGHFQIEVDNDRVKIQGQAKTYLVGEIVL